MTNLQINTLEQLAWDKMDNLIPAVIQDQHTLQVLMVGYLSQESLAETLKTNQVTFYSRSKNRLWTKGETSGNFLNVVAIYPDCDNDSILILVKPVGPACHLGTTSCFNQENHLGVGLLAVLENIILDRQQSASQKSYTASLLQGDVTRVAQKVGEEGVEVALAAATGHHAECTEESADLLYHLLVLLRRMDLDLDDVLAVLKKRMAS